MTTIASLTEKILAFRDERDWHQFHNPKDMAPTSKTRQGDRRLACRSNAITFDFSKLNAEYALAPFTIERRIKTPDSEREYFSQAPMQTGQHFQLLQEFERDLSQPL
jgi:aerobic-type carbon monoxide dehydrogenase small subunit (CoxS/CutS family)